MKGVSCILGCVWLKAVEHVFERLERLVGTFWGKYRLCQKMADRTPLGMLRFHQQFTEEKDGVLQRCINIRVFS